MNYLTPLRDAGCMCFRQHVYHEIKATARNAVLALIHSDRVGLYENDFEAQMLEDTRNYYSTKAALWISLFSFPDFLKKAEECLKQEEERVSHYLHSTTKEKLLLIVQNELLSPYLTQLVQNEHKGCPALLRDHKKDDLSRMYRLFSKISKGVDTIASCLIQQVTTEGRIIAKQAEEEEDSNALVGNFIQLQDRYVEYVEDAFQKNIIISKGLILGFEAICGNDVGGSTFAEILAIFCDNLLSKGGQVKKTDAKLSDGDVENMLEKVVKLVGYISDKDIFGELYRKKLASRILSDENFNLSIEQQVIAKLAEQNGKRYTSKMEFMIKDLVIASEGKSAFDEYLGSGNINLGTELRVKVLTTPFWPISQSYISQPNLPSDIANCVQVFKAYYSAQNERRILTWIYSLGTCNIRGNFDNQMEIEMTVSTYQAMILLLFNDHEKLSRAEIKSELNLADDKHVDKHLHSIAGSKYKILLKQPANTKVVSPADTFEVNPNFSSNLKRIRIPFPPPLEEKVGNKKVLMGVEDDRKLAIQACVVRIMKSRKVLDCSRLLNECFNELKSVFKPDVKAIKNEIEFLISKDFLQLDQENPQNLKYVA
eukprot:PITA_21380